MKQKEYSHSEIESKWQKRWLNSKVYSPDLHKAKKPFYNLFMFPYPSAEGLHAGHAMSSTGSDIYGRFKRMNGNDVFQPMGYDSFGIHSENYAIKIGESPQTMLKRSVAHFEEQFKSFGHGYDWTHTLMTSDVNYYHWTQWLFKEFFKAGLAYRKKAKVNFCPKDKTVLSDEQVMTPKQAGKDPIDSNGNPVPLTEGLMVCERCGTIVEKRELDVWFFRITDYAGRLLDNLQTINWSQRVIVAQREWIGKSKGLDITFKTNEGNSITVWTKFWETIYGATFLVIAPENQALSKLNIPQEFRQAVTEYIELAKNKSDDERNANKIKTGVFTGIYAKNPVNGKDIPVYVADYVLTSVGTGAVMGVPAHDERDFEFAKKYHLDIVQVVHYQDKDLDQKVAKGEISFSGGGELVNSSKFNGLDAQGVGKKNMASWMIKEGFAKWNTTYHLRDWGIGRQRYWGCPIPMIYCEHCAANGDGWITSNKAKLHQDQSDWDNSGWWPDENLPVKLPVINDYKPEGQGRGPLANHPEFYKVKCPHCGKNARRETDVADTFLDSSWYFLRYPSTDFDKVPFDPEITKKWLPVNQYFGGAEHAVLHLMYARFVTMALHDLKHITFEEPFPNFFAHGLMIKDGAKMSKSRGNVVNPDEYIKKFGADTLRIYLVFIGPMDSFVDFRDTGIEGMDRFFRKIWSLYQEKKEAKDKKELLSVTHKTIQKVTKDITIFHYNTAISAIMQFVNYMKENGSTKDSLKILCQLLAPFTPHLAEELWVEILSEKYSVHISKWPQFKSQYIKIDKSIIIVQVNGKTRGQLALGDNNSQDKKTIEELVKKDDKLSKWLNNQKIVNIILVPGKIINFVTAQNAADK